MKKLLISVILLYSHVYGIPPVTSEPFRKEQEVKDCCQECESSAHPIPVEMGSE